MIDAIINPQSFLRHHGDLGFAGHLADPPGQGIVPWVNQALVLDYVE